MRREQGEIDTNTVPLNNMRMKQRQRKTRKRKRERKEEATAAAATAVKKVMADTVDSYEQICVI